MYRHVSVKFDSAKVFRHVFSPFFRPSEGSDSDFPCYSFSDGRTMRQDILNKDQCTTARIPMHCIANMVAALMGDYPVPHFRRDVVPENPRMGRYEDIARRSKVQVDTVEMNVETIWHDKANHRGACGPKSSGYITLDGVTYKLRTAPSFLVMEEAVGKAEWARIDAMFAKYLGDGYSDRMSIAEAISEVRKAYRSGRTADFDGFAAETEAMPDAVTYERNSIVIPVTTGKPSGTVSKTNGDGVVEGKFQSFRLDSASPRIRLLGLGCAGHGIESDVYTLSGTIHLKVTEEELAELLVHGQVATLLDGGVAIMDPDSFMDDWSERFDQYDEPYEA